MSDAILPYIDNGSSGAASIIATGTLSQNKSASATMSALFSGTPKYAFLTFIEMADGSPTSSTIYNCLTFPIFILPGSTEISTPITCDFAGGGIQTCYGKAYIATLQDGSLTIAKSSTVTFPYPVQTLQYVIFG